MASSFKIRRQWAIHKQPFSIQEGSGECRSTETLGAEHMAIVTADPHPLAGSQPEDGGVTRLCTSSGWIYYNIDLKQYRDIQWHHPEKQLDAFL